MDSPAGEDDVQCPAEADIWEPDGIAVDQRHAPPPAEYTEYGTPLNNPHVAEQGKLKPAGNCIPPQQRSRLA